MLSGAECTKSFKFPQSGNLKRCARLSYFVEQACAHPNRAISRYILFVCGNYLRVAYATHNKQNVFLFAAAQSITKVQSAKSAGVFASQKLWNKTGSLCTSPHPRAVAHPLQDLPLGKSWRFARENKFRR